MLPPRKKTAMIDGEHCFHNRDLGRQGEEIAAAYLEEKGLRVLERNYRTPMGEIDIVAEDGEVLVFCEVKTRADLEFGPPEAAITEWKRRQMRRMAAIYLADRGIEEHLCRFDVVAVIVSAEGRTITHFPEAFIL